jgi:biopolymer transport protein ExbD
MPAVEKPGKRLVVGVPLRFIAKMAEGHARTTPIADLNVTPMVDMLTMLVIFLLMTFSASGELLSINKDITLPKAYHATELERAPVIAISNKQILLDSKFIMDATEADAEKYPDWKLTPLWESLQLEREKWKAYHPTQKFPGALIIQSDKSVPFSVVKMIMHTSALAEYSSLNFAVQRTDRTGAALGP